jgi:hypothetical protein
MASDKMLGSFDQKSAPEDNDLLVEYDASASKVKNVKFGGVWNWIVKKLTSAVINELQTSSKNVVGAINELNSNQVFNNLLIYRTSGANIKSVTISINKEGSNDISYAPFALFGGSTFLTGTIGKINNTLKTGDVTIKCNDNDSIQNVKFSNFPQYANAVIIIYYENIKNAIVKEE